ncbi:MAG: response regulator transcription factor [Planctomycetes bacterium]|nr:response regulator transcription factor [Planctomycetota bacterium]
MHRKLLADLLVASLLQSGVRRAFACDFSSRRSFPKPIARPDVVLLDPGNPCLDAFGFARRLLRRSPGTRVILSADSTPFGWVEGALRIGASGYLGKCADIADYVRAIRAAMVGQRYFTPCAGRIVAEIASGTAEVPAFTPRQRAIQDLICRGSATKEIARRLGLKVKTVEAARSVIMAETGTSSAPALVRYACAHRLVPLLVDGCDDPVAPPPPTSERRDSRVRRPPGRIR